MQLRQTFPRKRLPIPQAAAVRRGRTEAAGQRRQDRNGGRGIREQLLWIINRGAAVLIAGSSRDLPRHPVWCGRHLPLSQYG
jgi:hypothetical protein